MERQNVGRLVSAIFDEQPDKGRSILEPIGFVDTCAAYECLTRIVAPLNPGERTEMAVAVLLETLDDSADPDMALANWDRFFEASFSRTTAATMIADDPSRAEILSRLFGHSQFLTDILIRHPEHADWFYGENLSRPKSPEAYEQEMADTVGLFREEESRRNGLCRYHRRELLRIGLRDIMGWASLEITTAEISDLAQATIRTALALIEEKIQGRYGEPRGPDGDSACGFAVIALGKLGGRELNYSSDVDLMFVYSDQGKTTGRADPTGHQSGSVTNDEYFARLGTHLINFLSEHGPEGHLYRVDMRLRPEGKSGALAHTFAACESYYLSRARPWERVAFLKARGIAGDAGLIEQFEMLARGFVFAPADPEELLNEVARLKETIDDEVRRSEENGREIKRGRGGIREVEFVAATLVILHGQNRPDLRKRATLEMIEALRNARILVEADADLMEEAYRFFRRIEHALQAMEWLQTHLLPTDANALVALARRVGIEAEDRKQVVERFRAKYRDLSNRVHLMFEDMFRASEQPQKAGDEAALQLLDPAVDEEKLNRLLARWRFRDSGAAESLRRLARGTGNLYVSSDGQKTFERILPALLESCAKAPWPEKAVNHFEAFMQACGNASGYYTLFDENRPTFDLLMRYFGTSDMLSERLIANPGWFDPLIAASTFQEHPEWLRRPADDPEAEDCSETEDRLRLIRRFSSLNLLRIGIRYVGGIESVERTTDALADNAEAAIRMALHWAMTDALGREDAPDRSRTRFAVLGFGKLGRCELTFQSDLDLVFISDADEEVAAVARAFFAKVAERLVYYLTDASTGERPFRVDTRLRPEGSGSPLVTSLTGLTKYFDRRSEVWEIQAYLGGRVMAGDVELGGEALRCAWAVAERLGSAAEIAEAILSMRERLEQSVKLPAWAAHDFKRGSGGLVDLEFLSQYFQIVHAGEEPDLPGLPPRHVLVRCREQGWLAEETAQTLIEDYDFLRKLETNVRLVFESQETCFPADRTRLEALIHAPAQKVGSGDVLRQQVERRTERIRRLFREVLGASDE